MPKIAIVNDDTDFLTLMNELLATNGWETAVCREGPTAYAFVKAEKPDLVILDIRMDGTETGWLEMLTLDPETKDCPIIICSAAVVDLEAKSEWLQAHGIATLTKPFDIDDLYAAVKHNLKAQVPAKPSRP
jgi:DNA-binding response OmpR family regulator